MKASDQLITQVNLTAYHTKIKYTDSIIMTGSCFSEHIGLKLHRFKYNVLQNPFGILYNPVSIARSFERIANKELYHEDELIIHDDLFHSMDHHSSFSGRDKEQVLKSINESIENARLQMAKSKFVFISLGSAKMYHFKETGDVVGNCHKIPQSSFISSRIGLPECVMALEKMVRSIKQVSPDAHIIWTVSPVRHLRDGIEENQRSKALLLLAIDQLLSDQSHGGYFPAYEIMMDQLRDYRFYARDLIHPSSLAIDIIWDIFTDTYLDLHERETHPFIEKIKRAMEHRFFNENKEVQRTFAENQLKNIEHLAGIYPDINWKEERQYFFHLTEQD
jgi:hypothetical protein